VDQSRLYWFCSRSELESSQVFSCCSRNKPTGGEIICTLELREMHESWRKDRAAVEARDAGQWNLSSAGHSQPKKPHVSEDPDVGIGGDMRVVVAMGLVKHSTFPVHLFDLATTCSCAGFEVASGTKTSRLDIDASLSEGPVLPLPRHSPVESPAVEPLSTPNAPSRKVELAD
jgi:hypothetical protein